MTAISNPLLLSIHFLYIAHFPDYLTMQINIEIHEFLIKVDFFCTKFTKKHFLDFLSIFDFCNKRNILIISNEKKMNLDFPDYLTMQINIDLK